MARYDEFGNEIANQTPVAIPAGYHAAPSINEIIRQYVRQEMSKQAAESGFESFEEADDFEVDEDPDPLSAYEIPDSPVEFVDEKDPDAVEIDSKAPNGTLAASKPAPKGDPATPAVEAS